MLEAKSLALKSRRFVEFSNLSEGEYKIAEVTTERTNDAQDCRRTTGFENRLVISLLCAEFFVLKFCKKKFSILIECRLLVPPPRAATAGAGGGVKAFKLVYSLPCSSYTLYKYPQNFRPVVVSIRT